MYLDTLDEDERAMASEENQSATTLLVQPSCVSGGLMRYVHILVIVCILIYKCCIYYICV